MLFLLPLVAALVAGDIVANEDANGTLKTILTRSVDRGQMFAAKTLAAMTYATAAVFLSATVATVAGLASWGFHSITSLSGTVVSALRSAAARVRRQRLLPDPAVRGREHRRAALRHDAQQRGGGRRHDRPRDPARHHLGDSGPGRHPALPAHPQFEAWQGLLRTPTDWAPIIHSAWVCALYGVPALIAGYLVFLRRDVAGG